MADNMFEEKDLHYFPEEPCDSGDEQYRDSSRRSHKDQWFSRNWGASPGSKRQRPTRITEMWRCTKKRRQESPRSPKKGSPDKRKKETPDRGVSLEAKETLAPSSRWSSPSVFATETTVEDVCNVDDVIVCESMDIFGARAKAAALGAASGLSKARRFGTWSEEEDNRLREAVMHLCSDAQMHAKTKPWSVICIAVPGRAPKQCRERFLEHLDVKLVRTPYTVEEYDAILSLVETHGRKLSVVCKELNKWRESRGHEGFRSCTSVKNLVARLQSPRKTKRAVSAQAQPERESGVAENLVALDEFVDFLDFDAFLSSDDNASTKDKEQSLALHGSCTSSPLECETELLLPEPEVSTEVIRMQPVERVGGYNTVRTIHPQRCSADRKMTLNLSEGHGPPRRALFENINKMINTPRPLNSVHDTQVARHGEASRRGVSVMESVHASARAWAAAATK
jgi:hypothetical protein